MTGNLTFGQQVLLYPWLLLLTQEIYKLNRISARSEIITWAYLSSEVPQVPIEEYKAIESPRSQQSANAQACMFQNYTYRYSRFTRKLYLFLSNNFTLVIFDGALCIQSFLNENACSGDKSSAKVLFEHPSTTFVHTKT